MVTTNMMEHKGFKARIMEAERLTGDYVHRLPPGSPLPVYPMDMFLNPPENWMKGPGVFVVPVRPNKGLWFDWRMNSDNNTAVIPTVKGCNPITGMQTSGFHMERYENKCPKHGCDFMHDRFCPECNYKWPPQNYIGPKNTLWWDGFLNQKDGTVRQFFFSEEELRDVASVMIGKENTVPAFGFAFYASKEPRPEPAGIYLDGKVYKYDEAKMKMFAPPSNNFYTSSNTTGIVHGQGSTGITGTDCKINYMSHTPGGTSDALLCSAQASEEKTSGGLISDGGLDTFEYTSPLKELKAKGSFKRSISKIRDESYRGLRSELRCSTILERREPVKEVSIGAGARIDQKLNPDPYELSSWKEAPDSVMTIYFVFQEKFEEIKAKGVRDIEGSKEGMLSNCVVG